MLSQTFSTEYSLDLGRLLKQIINFHGEGVLVHATKAYGGVEVQLHSFLTLAKVSGQFHPLGALPPRKVHPVPT